MQRIQKASSYLLIIFNALLIILPIFAIVPWLLIKWPPLHTLIQGGFLFHPIQTPEGFVNLTSLHLTPLSQSIGAGASVLGTLPVFLGILVLKYLFQNYQRGEIFSLQNAKYYQKLGWLFFLDALLIAPLHNMLMILAATLSNPPGHRYITISFGSPNLESLFWGFLVIVISWVMIEGHRLSEDQQFTI